VSFAVLRTRYIRDGPEPQAGRDMEQDRAHTSLADISEMAPARGRPGALRSHSG
jgi:hypothetical protein